MNSPVQAMSIALQQIAIAEHVPMSWADMVSLAKATMGEYCAPVPDGWRDAESAPKDGTHILVCCGIYDEHWTFDQQPPQVVHYFPDPDEPGFYLSSGLVENSYNDHPVAVRRWMPLPFPPVK